MDRLIIYLIIYLHLIHMMIDYTGMHCVKFCYLLLILLLFHFIIFLLYFLARHACTSALENINLTIKSLSSLIEPYHRTR